jgi:hypothetical protein
MAISRQQNWQICWSWILGVAWTKPGRDDDGDLTATELTKILNWWRRRRSLRQSPESTSRSSRTPYRDIELATAKSESHTTVWIGEEDLQTQGPNNGAAPNGIRGLWFASVGLDYFLTIQEGYILFSRICCIQTIQWKLKEYKCRDCRFMYGRHVVISSR